MLKPLSSLFLLVIMLCAGAKHAEASFGGHIGSHLGIGNAGGSTQPVGNTSLGTLDLQLMPGYRFLGTGLMPGAFIDLRFLSELAGSTSYGTEISGTGTTLGIGLLYELGLLKFLAAWDLRARHSHSNPDTTYKGSGYTVLIAYKTLPDFYMDLLFNQTHYNSREVLGVNETLPGKNTLTHWNLAIGASYSF